MNYLKSENIEIFKDTQKLIRTNEPLKESVRRSVSTQKYYCSQPQNPDYRRFDVKAEITVTKKRSFQAAKDNMKHNQKVCVLNFASAFNPGGGVEKGATAQEECLCRISTLREVISDTKIMNQFYSKNRTLIEKKKMNGAYSDDCIYTPGITVFRQDDKSCDVLPEKEWYNVDVITCAAPDLRIKPYRLNYTPSMDELAEVHEKRARMILDIAVKEKADVMILGAFGCGAFQNPPDIVAAVYSKVLEDYMYSFKKIEFAVYCSPGNQMNYQVFKRVFDK